jgi:hypothetical protein
MPEVIMDSIWEAMPEQSEGWGYSFYPARETYPTPELYFKSPDGRCWKIEVNEHPHPNDPDYPSP